MNETEILKEHKSWEKALDRSLAGKNSAHPETCINALLGLTFNLIRKWWIDRTTSPARGLRKASDLCKLALCREHEADDPFRIHLAKNLALSELLLQKPDNERLRNATAILGQAENEAETSIICGLINNCTVDPESCSYPERKTEAAYLQSVVNLLNSVLEGNSSPELFASTSRYWNSFVQKVKESQFIEGPSFLIAAVQRLATRNLGSELLVELNDLSSPWYIHDNPEVPYTEKWVKLNWFGKISDE